MFKENLKRIMGERGYSAAELSRMTGIGKPNISNWLRGKNNPRPEAFKTLADALDCPVYELTDGCGYEPTTLTKEVRSLSIADAALLCGKNRDDLGDAIERGQCPFAIMISKPGEKRNFLIPPKRLEKWLAGEL